MCKILLFIKNLNRDQWMELNDREKILFWIKDVSNVCIHPTYLCTYIVMYVFSCIIYINGI